MSSLRMDYLQRMVWLTTEIRRRISDVEIATEYERLKRRLADTFRFDREAYTAAKGPFIQATTEEAVAAGYAMR